MTIIW